jgi:hypothetical protein
MIWTIIISSNVTTEDGQQIDMNNYYYIDINEIPWFPS